ncbi:MAG TPA: class I SAM-dependent methyltransferase [Pyrinomonadaceae bacterium]|nr:class I SAM-dependent methyltransferase [Pyrinomonadaceae bacterium]
MPLPIPKTERRSFERVREHYLIEKELAARLRAASKEERRHLYSTLYDELFQRVPDHPQLSRKLNTTLRRREVRERIDLLRRYLRADITYLEIGPGDCALAIEAARRVRTAIAVDVSREIASGVHLLRNLELLITDGSSIPVPPGSVDVAYSDQLMEHLHPDDAAEQIRNVHEALVPGGVYVCLTPNRWSGPHDISRYFDEEATGFHLREYTIAELTNLFKEAGFRQVKVLVGSKGVHLPVFSGWVMSLERLLERLPRNIGRQLARRLPLRVVLGAKVVARK